ncbi:ABC transporter substrate-binding protein [Magnetospira sp. QH-2]|uniref:substrate-binding periplasmic protein n=1 Tax=Magnetospira sp. (strain QH-2) TaxID=1288970 RepID=UPI0003E80AC6|nr:transporter substrate-binding domain-containing protein [Magnetospira sp. QH-2]CCQ73712.1 Exported protein of unknown function [Magnetospira sp. QH-2]
MGVRVILFVLALLGGAMPAAAMDLAICARAQGHPKHYVDSSGNPKGYAIEVAAEAVRRAGYRSRILNFPWKRAQKTALDGLCIITAFSVTEERKAKYLFSDSMFIDRVLLWQAAARPFPFFRFEDLIGKHIGIPTASYYAGEFDRVRPQLNLFEDSEKQVSLKMLIKGRLDAAIIPGDIAAAKFLARLQGVDFAQLKPSDTPISLDPNHIGVPKNLIGFEAAGLTEKLNAALAAMAADGTTRAILSRYQ